VEETSWVRSAYLYVMCAVSFALVAIGLAGIVGGLIHTVAPDLGHRDTLDRVGIGVSNVAEDVIDALNDSQRDEIEQFCEDITDGDDADFDDCIDDQLGSGSEMDTVVDGIGKVRSELQSQIRNNSVDRMIKGIIAMFVGVVLFRIHGRRTALFRDGLGLRRSTAAGNAAADAPPIVEMSPSATPPTDAAPPPPFSAT
jgi:hypothetical protein